MVDLTRVYGTTVSSRMSRNGASVDFLESSLSMFKLWRLGVLRAFLLAQLP